MTDHSPFVQKHRIKYSEKELSQKQCVEVSFLFHEGSEHIHFWSTAEGKYRIFPKEALEGVLGLLDRYEADKPSK